MAKQQQPLIWIDLEMTGLNPKVERIIEIATIVTDSELNVLAEGPVLAIHQDNALLDGMDDWNRKTHGESGLIERVKASTVTVADAETKTLDFLKQYVAAGKSPMCGNSIHQDRRFMTNEMPKLLAYFHYRNLDVSTLKELAKRWAPSVYNGLNKESRHIALDDIKDSINELKYYREKLFKV